jgi:hypothetical protein
MINCKDAKHLFGRYLDGQLSASLQTELHAHRLQCSDCQNELALLEACGDVIALDRREPLVSASFTDRVLLARRAQLKPMKRHWSRTMAIYGSPVAAAACIALMFSVVRPMPLPTAILTAQETPPKPVLNDMLKGARPLSPQAQKELAAVPSMSTDGFLDALIGPVLEKSRTTAEGARRGAESALDALRQALSSEHETLVNKWREAHPESEINPTGAASFGDPLAPDDEREEPASPSGDVLRNPLY